jgi:hypothetical protein
MTDTPRAPEARSHERLIRDLEAQHSAFDRTLAEELRRPSPDAVLIRRLKRAKLALKDRVAMLAHAVSPTTSARQRG